MDQPDGAEVLPGMAGYATAKIPPPEIIEQLSGVQIPLSAVFAPDEPEQSYVWVIAGAAATRRAVRTGGLTDHGIRITDGLKPGEWVATAGVNFLSEGQKVRILGKPSEGTE